jgi:hypothetical protein
MALSGFHPGCQVFIASPYANHAVKSRTAVRRAWNDLAANFARWEIVGVDICVGSRELLHLSPPKQQKIPCGLPGICCHCSTLRKITPVERGSFRDWNGVAYSTFVPANRPAAWLFTRDEADRGEYC